MAALFKLVPESQVIFGIDYRHFSIGAQAASPQKLGLIAALTQAFKSGNPTRLKPRLKT